MNKQLYEIFLVAVPVLIPAIISIYKWSKDRKETEPDHEPPRQQKQVENPGERSSGITVWSDRAEAENAISTALKKANTIHVMGIKCQFFTDNHAQRLLKYLNAGKEIEIILWDPLCYGAIERALDEIGPAKKSNPADWVKGVFDRCKNREERFNFIIEALDRCKYKTPQLKLLLQTSQPTTTCIITEEFVFFNHYGINQYGNFLPTFRISKSLNSKIYQQYKDQFTMYSKDAANCFDFSNGSENALQKLKDHHKHFKAVFTHKATATERIENILKNRKFPYQ